MSDPNEMMAGMGMPSDPMAQQKVSTDNKNMSPLNKVDFAKLVNEGALTPEMTIDDALQVFGMNAQMTLREVMPFWKDLKMKASPTYKAMSQGGQQQVQSPPSGGEAPVDPGLDKLMGGL